MRYFELKKLILCGVFTAFGVLLPMIFHAFNLGKVMLPMHIPVLFCGLICGMMFGAACGILSPLLSSFLTGMPPIYPIGVSMIFELCFYGFFAGFFMFLFKRDKIVFIYISLILAMIIGRVLAFFTQGLLLGFKEDALNVYISSGIIVSIPGIAVQIILIPPLSRFLFYYAKISYTPLSAKRSKEKINSKII